MKKTLQILIGLAGVLFLFTGIRWLLDPGTAAQTLGMPLLDGIGRSTQIGDLASFFLSLGFMIFAGLITGRRVWFYPPVMLLGLSSIVPCCGLAGARRSLGNAIDCIRAGDCHVVIFRFCSNL